MNSKHDPEAETLGRLSRRGFLKAGTAGAAALLWTPHPATQASEPATPTRAPIQNRAPLRPQRFLPLPLGSIKPNGWLRRQLEIQASGLSGHLGEIWPDVGVSCGWLGGSGDAWERAPYYLDGLVPLAWQLNSDELKSKALRYIESIFSSQSPEGMFGPKDKDPGTAMDPWWPRIVAMKALTQYEEATGDPRVVPLLSRYFRYQQSALQDTPLSLVSRVRWQDQIVSLIWLYNRTGDSRLLDLAQVLKQQGVAWSAVFADFPFKERVTVRQYYLMPEAVRDLCHGVNNAMAIKASAVWSIVSGNAAESNGVQRQLETLDRYHGLPTGIFSADENLAGRNPSQGTELCVVVETMFSLEQALAITGGSAFADRLEKIAYNALPAAFTDDMWAHQYDQQANQIQCSVARSAWATNREAANIFGLEPQFGCCTANYHQGWPKFTASLWMATSDGGIAAMLYAPCEVSTALHGVSVHLVETTDYPFAGQAHITVDPATPLLFALRLRVPGTATRVRLALNGRAQPQQVRDGFAVLERTWRKGDRIDLMFDFEVRAVRGFNGSVHIERGPLVFALPVGTRWEKIHDYSQRAADWEVYPMTAWNYAIEENSPFNVREQALAPVPFSSQSPAAKLDVIARRVPGWISEADTNYAQPPPQSPIDRVDTYSETLTLVPYAGAKLRITSLPTVKG